MDKIEVILIDDHHIVRDGIKILLMNIKDIEVVGEASNGDELFELLKTKDPDVLILDIMMPGMSGIEITEKIKNDYPGIKVIILSANTDDESVFDSLKAGAHGYLPKNARREELLEAVYMVAAGNEFLSDSISHTVLRSFITRARTGNRQEKDKEATLTKRELEIVELFAEGLSYKEIADRLFISVRTVESHKNNIMEKLELKSIVDLVKYAIKHKIIEL
ncbi:MAG: response regulator transcription factor [Saprospiraceae bacterium]|nr:response regulator transcription factor [Saprospiraceae bacterium]